MDNFQIHSPSAFYEEAKRLWDRFEFIYTPEHGLAHHGRDRITCAWKMFKETLVDDATGSRRNHRLASVVTTKTIRLIGALLPKMPEYNLKGYILQLMPNITRVEIATYFF